MLRKKMSVVVVTLCAGMLSFASGASAQVRTISVPLDHAAPGGAQTRIAYRHMEHRDPAPQRGTIVFLSGGPGEAATPFAREIARGPLRRLWRDHDLVFVDQRGSGRSNPLRCSTAPNGRFSPNLSGRRLLAAIAACGVELGSERRHYSTYATALDLEEVRKALGVERIVPLGVSYGATVAGEYARRFPDRLDAVVMDSASPVETLDTMSTLPQLALARVFREACYPPGCSELIGRPVTLIAEASARLLRRPLAGLTAQDVYSLVKLSDLDPLVRTDIPATLQAAIHRDAGPLRRLARYAERGADEAATGINEVRFLATACVEGNQPWDPVSDPGGREALFEQHLRTHRRDYGPFPIEAVARQLPAVLCLAWPPTPRAPLPPNVTAGPDVPVLVLAGREDLRTPLESQRRVGAQFPRARVHPIPDVGHSVLTHDLSGCAVATLRAFLSGRPLAPACRERARQSDIALPYFDALRDVPRARGRLSERVERTATAVDLTLRDALRWAPSRGVRGGRARAGDETLVLSRYELVPGVRVSGTYSLRRRGRLRVTGSGATGTLIVRPSGRMSGVLDGEIVRYRPLAIVG
jgi:pimeloyl-ACP methyl ester carboxylesterase